MGRRFISATSINRLISSFSARSAQKERDYLIQQSANTAKELPIRYELIDVEFNPETRITDVKFQSIKTYRTVERYVTQNYKRYPIYSAWKTKCTTTTKHLKLTNQNLEALNDHEDSLIREFAPQIILSLEDESYIPSWLSRQIIDNDYYLQLGDYNKEIGELDKYFQERVKIDNNRINNCNQQIEEINNQQIKLNKDISKVQRKLDFIHTHKCPIYIAIITFGIYSMICSKRRETRLQAKLSKLQHENEDKTNQVTELNTKIDRINSEQKEAKDEKNKNIAEIRHKITALQKAHDNDLSAIKPLSTYIDTTGFVPLKSLTGYAYEKIIGCYIIRNTELDKYYVGQSKDVLKRLKQHFRGTVPNNVIFAEDYYSTKYSDKENLFEVKIIPLNTKDELDKNEAMLIDEYEARTKGYNSTKGNT